MKYTSDLFGIHVTSSVLYLCHIYIMHSSYAMRCTFCLLTDSLEKKKETSTPKHDHDRLAE